MIKYERVGEAELRCVDTSAVNKVLELAKLAKDCPDDLRAALIRAIGMLTDPTLMVKEKTS